MKRNALYIVMLVLFSPFGGQGFLCAHEFETGHIERSIDVVVRGQKIQVKYAIGLADETIVDWLVREKMLASSDEARYRKCIADLEADSEPESSQLASSQPKKGEESSKADSDLKQGFKPFGSPVETGDVAAPLAFQTELMQLLRDKLAQSVSDNIELSFDGNEVDFVDVTVASSSRHHVAMEIVLAAELPEPTKAELLLIDRNFLELDEAASSQVEKSETETVTETSAKNAKIFRYFGNVRLACRVKGNAIQLNSNVAPVLTRAKPQDVNLPTLKERMEAATIRTKIGFAELDAR